VPAAAAQTAPKSPVVSEAQRLIRQQRYNDAINRLEMHLEAAPQDGEAMAYLGAAHLYAERETARAREVFEASFAAGGGASFWVNHSHQTMLDGDDLTDYCRGWLNLRRGYVEFDPEDGDHGFRTPSAEVAEFKQNRNKTFFHIKRGGKNLNFRPRSADQRETLLLLILFNKFSR
jgi:hypothetical protein